MSTEPMSLQEIADVLGVSKQMVAKIEKRAVAKARVILEENGYTLEDFANEMRQKEEAQPPESYPMPDQFGG